MKSETRIRRYLALLFTFHASLFTFHVQAAPSPWLAATVGERAIARKPLALFRDPACCQERRREIEYYFRHHFGQQGVLQADWRPRAVIVHATENDSEADTYDFFDSPSVEYLGGVWSHFAVDAAGRIYQYAPLDRASKAHYGANDLAVGIEIVGRVGARGSVYRRWQAGDRRQLDAATDLVATMMARYGIPAARVFSHQELARVRDLRGRNPDFDWLRAAIRDRCFLGLAPDLDGDGRPTTRSGRLEPYDRYDPGRENMAVIRARL